MGDSKIWEFFYLENDKVEGDNKFSRARQDICQHKHEKRKQNLGNESMLKVA